MRCFVVALLGFYMACLGIWGWMYGWDNKFVYSTGMWFASHLLLAVLMNVMFYMIRLYRFALKSKEEEEKKKKKEE